MAKKTIPQPLTSETCDEIRRVVSESPKPLTSKEVVALLNEPHAAKEPQVIPVLQDYVDKGLLYPIPPVGAKGKPRFWNQDLTAIISSAAHDVIKAQPSPLTSAEIVSRLSLPVAISEVELAPILEKFVTEHIAFVVPAEKPAAKVRYWNKDWTVVVIPVIWSVLENSPSPLTVSEVTKLLTSLPFKLSENSVQSVFTQLESDGRLKTYAPEKESGKVRYWDRDLTEVKKLLVLAGIRNAPAPLLAKDLVNQLQSPLKLTEVDVTRILEGCLSTDEVYRYESPKPKGKPRYWYQNLTQLGRVAVQDAIRLVDGPVTAKELIPHLKSEIQFTETDLIPLLEQLVSENEIRRFDPSSGKGKPRYWGGDLNAWAKGELVKLLNRGPQVEATLKKAVPELSNDDSTNLLQELLDAGKAYAHPAVPGGKSKGIVYSSKPPLPGDYLKALEKPLSQIVQLLLASKVDLVELRRGAFQLLETAGIPIVLPSTAEATGAVPGANLATDTTKAEGQPLLDLMHRLEPGAGRGALVGARDLRRIAKMGKSEFDSQVLALARQGILSLHQHDFAQSLTPEERDELVTDSNGTYYVGMAIRQS